MTIAIASAIVAAILVIITLVIRRQRTGLRVLFLLRKTVGGRHGWFAVRDPQGREFEVRKPLG